MWFVKDGLENLIMPWILGIPNCKLDVAQWWERPLQKRAAGNHPRENHVDVYVCFPWLVQPMVMSFTDPFWQRHHSRQAHCARSWSIWPPVKQQLHLILGLGALARKDCVMISSGRSRNYTLIKYVCLTNILCGVCLEIGTKFGINHSLIHNSGGEWSLWLPWTHHRTTGHSNLETMIQNLFG